MNTLSMNQAAKVIGLGRNTMFQILRKHNILEDDNTPYQTYIDRGYFEVVVKQIFPSYSKKIKYEPVTLITDKGIFYIHKLLKDKGYNVKSNIIAV